MKKTAILIGATGLTGSLTLALLLKDNRYEKVKVFTRRSTGLVHEKLEEVVCDVLNLNAQKEKFVGDEVYVCIGTTKKKTPDEAMYRAIDVGIPVAAASLANENSIPSMAVVSAIGADEQSNFIYNRIKGEMERKVTEQGVPKTFILRPSLIMGQRIEKRSGERFAQVLFRFLNGLMIGPLKQYRGVEAKAIAQRMIDCCNEEASSRIIESDEI